jgi:arylsulfatase A-like enzyme
VTISLDWLPSFAAAAGFRGEFRNRLDGANVLPALLGESAAPDRTLFWAFRDELVGTPMSYAARRGRWKYLKIGEQEFLFDVEGDPGETRDVSSQQARVFDDIRREVEAWRAELGPSNWTS